MAATIKILETFPKQPADRQDYDIDFTEWLAQFSDTGLSHTASVAPVGITLTSSSLSAGVVKVWLDGGTTGTTYKVTVNLTTTGGRIKQAEINIKVLEV